MVTNKVNRIHDRSVDCHLVFDWLAEAIVNPGFIHRSQGAAQIKAVLGISVYREMERKEKERRAKARKAREEGKAKAEELKRKEDVKRRRKRKVEKAFFDVTAIESDASESEEEVEDVKTPAKRRRTKD